MTPAEMLLMAKRLEKEVRALRAFAEETATLFDNPEPATKPDAPASKVAKPPRPNLAADVARDFSKQWRFRYGVPYIATPDLPSVGKMLGGMSREQVAMLPAAFTRYIASTEPFLVEHRHPLRNFCTHPSRWMVEAAKPADGRRYL